MESREIIQKIKDDLQCPICLGQLKDSKILPCLHHFCKGCLAQISKDGAVNCPVCRRDYGIDEVQTDFRANSMIESLELEGAAAAGPESTEGHSELHLCHIHPGKALDMYCTTCDDLPICALCQAEGHDDHGGKSKEELFRKLQNLEDKILERKGKIQQAMNNFNEAVDEKRKALRRELGAERDSNSQQHQKRDKEFRRQKKEAKERLKRELEKMEEANDEEKTKLDEQMAEIERGSSELKTELEEEETRKNEMFKKLAKAIEENDKQCKDITAEATSDLTDGKNDTQRSHDICAKINRLVDRVENLQLSEVEELSKVTVPSLSSSLSRGTRVYITDEEESITPLKEEGEGWNVLGLAGSPEGRIVVTGEERRHTSHITEVDLNGNVVRRTMLETSSQSALRYCKVLSQSEIATVCRPNELGVYKIGQAEYHQVDIHQVDRGIPPKTEVVCLAVDPINRSIYVGRYGLRKVYMFDKDLSHIRTAELPPSMFDWPHDMAIHGGNLLVCDAARKKACALKIDSGYTLEVNYTFAKPDTDEERQAPYSVCTDSRSYVYILWKTTVEVPGKPLRRSKKKQQKSVIVQYSRDGQQILQKKIVDCCSDVARCITVMKTAAGEKLLMATKETARLITYGLVIRREPTPQSEHTQAEGGQ